MMYIVDTDVLVPFSHPDNPNYQIVQDAVQKLKVEGHQLLTTSQNLAEFWNVSTRPTNAKNGLGRTPSETEQFLQELERLFPLMPDSPEMYPEWRRLVVKHKVLGTKVFDARLVALMISYNVERILTFNTKDFTRYTSEGIVAVDPATV